MPTGEQALTPPLASTLVVGQRDAVLVDVLATEGQAQQLTDRVAATGKRLRHVFITHGHADHWFGLATLLRRFPETEVVATAETIATMTVQGSPEMRAQVWDNIFPSQLGDTSVVASVSPTGDHRPGGLRAMHRQCRSHRDRRHVGAACAVPGPRGRR